MPSSSTSSDDESSDSLLSPEVPAWPVTSAYADSDSGSTGQPDASMGSSAQSRSTSVRSDTTERLIVIGVYDAVSAPTIHRHVMITGYNLFSRLQITDPMSAFPDEPPGVRNSPVSDRYRTASAQPYFPATLQKPPAHTYIYATADLSKPHWKPMGAVGNRGGMASSFEQAPRHNFHGYQQYGLLSC